MSVPLIQQARIGAYLMKQRLRGVSRYPLVLMLEPLFRCNLTCAGCGKIDYPADILDRRLSAAECLAASDECGAPIVSIAGGEPLLHKEIEAIVAGIIQRKRFVYLCTNALLLEKRLDRFSPTPYLTFSVHLDGMRDHHDKAVGLDGAFDKATAALKEAARRGFRTTINCTLFANSDVAEMAEFFTFACDELKVEGVTIAPGYAYERAPVQAQFLTRSRTKQLFRDLLKRGQGRNWRFNQSGLYLDFLAGNQPYRCTPWGNPTRNVFGWQRPCYLINEGQATTFKELMEGTAWETYGTGAYEKCADCMMHCGYEPTAVMDILSHPLKAARVALFGPRTDGDMAPEIALEGQRPAEDVHDEVVRSAVLDRKAG